MELLTRAQLQADYGGGGTRNATPKKQSRRNSVHYDGGYSLQGSSGEESDLDVERREARRGVFGAGVAKISQATVLKGE